MINKNIKNITFIIHPTKWQDFDICAIGHLSLLKAIKKSNKHFYLAKRSKFGGIPILLLDTCNTLKDAMFCLKDYKELYESKQLPDTIMPDNRFNTIIYNGTLDTHWRFFIYEKEGSWFLRVL